MRIIIITATAVLAVNLMALGLSFAQTGSYNRCVELASRQGLSAKSTRGQNFVARCMQRTNPGPSRNCPDDPKARSAYPAWMCP